MRDAPRHPRRLPVVLLGTALLFGGLLTGCGVPSSGPPVVVSSAPANGSNSDPQLARQKAVMLPAPATATNPRDLVSLFFSAAGVDTNPDQVRADVTQFFTPSSRGSWRPDPAGLTVVRVADYSVTDQRNTGTRGSPTPSAGPSGGGHQDTDVAARASVRVTGRIIGLLNATGTVQPLPADRSSRYDRVFHLEKIDKVWLIANPPTETVLSTEAMSSEYDPTVVYFASPDHNALVPDLRYLPKTMPVPKRRTVLVDWLLDGPSTWLGQAATSAIPDGTKRRGNVVTSHDNVVVVNLTSDAGDAPYRGLMAAQLAWTLRPVMAKLQIRIEGRPLAVPGLSGTVHDWNTWRTYNVATIGADSSGYYISDGHITAGEPGDTLPPVLAGPAAHRVDDHVLHAGLSVDSHDIAVVRAGSDHRPQLWLGHAAGRDHGQATYLRATGLDDARTIGRPSFLTGTGSVIVPVDGTLRLVTASGTSTRVTSQRREPLRSVTAVSVAPDGCRIALVDDGHLYVAPLLGGGSDQVTLGRLRPLASDYTGLTEVAWTDADRVVFGGRGRIGVDGPLASGPRGGAWEFSIDGVSADLLTGTGDNAVPDQIASSTNDPSKGGAHGRILLAAHQQILQVTGNEVGPPGTAARPPHGTAPFFPS